MSLSSLGAQLAAINNSSQGKAALPTSKRHEDAIGRGATHSVKYGHATQQKDHLFKASILYEDAKKASNVPLTTIRENCVSSLRELEGFDAEFGKYIAPLCGTNSSEGVVERGLQTAKENDAIDKIIQELLYRLALRMNSNSTTSSCLHVVEYLLRQFDLHVRPKLASTTLLVLLQHHDQPFFLRFLQLTDLASLPTFSWLRPYAVPQGKIGRDIIAKHVSKNVALMRQVLQLAQTQSSLPNNDSSLTFCAAVLVEAMTRQQRVSGSVDERTCQAILPVVVQACRQTTRDSWRGFGHVLASTIVETSVLAIEPRNLMVTSILQGISGTGIPDASVQNALLVALTQLQQQISSTGLDPTSYQLLVNDSPHLDGGKVAFGYAMEKSILHALLKVESIATRMGQLYDSGFVDMGHWVASTWVVGWKRLLKKRQHHDAKKQTKIRTLLVDLLNEAHLKALWTQAWIEAATCLVLTNHIPLPTSGSDEHAYVQSLLQALRRKSHTAYDKGITQALLQTKKDQRLELAQWLGLATNKVPGGDNRGNPSEASSIQLPARVALEHADVEVRLEAIARVMQEENAMDIDDDSMAVDGAESVQGALLRRVVVDDDAQVANKAAEALCSILGTNNPALSMMDPLQLGEGCLGALQKWGKPTTQVEKELQSKLTLHMLRLAVPAGKALLSTGSHGKDNLMLVYLLETLAAKMLDTDKEVVEEAAKALVLVLGKGKEKPSQKQARLLLLSDIDRLAHFRRDLKDTSLSDDRRLFLSVMLQALPECLSSKTTKRIELSNLAWEASNYCKWAVNAYSKALTETERKRLSECLAKTSKHVASPPEKFKELALALADTDPEVFRAVGAPLVQSVAKDILGKSSKSSSGVGVVMELVLAASSPRAAQNLLALTDHCMNPASKDCHLAFVPALALLAHEDDDVRKKVIDLLVSLGDAVQAKSEWSCLLEISSYLSNNKSSAGIGGASFLPTFLRSVISSSKQASAIRTSLLKLCVLSAMSTVSESSPSSSKQGMSGWLKIGQAVGGYKTALTILQAAESAGETAFPLLVRWQHGGKPILEEILRLNSEDGQGVSAPALEELLTHIVLMLKGVKVQDSTTREEKRKNVIIMSGPAARGGRTRSYSFGRLDGNTFLSPYPKDMHLTIVDILTKNGGQEPLNHVQAVLSSQVLASHSWGKQVFIKLPEGARHKIARNVLLTAVEDMTEGAADALYSLPLSSVELSQLLDKQVDTASYLPSVSFLADFASSNSGRLAEESSLESLFSSLFKHLSSICGKMAGEDDEADFALHSLLSALNQLLEASALSTTHDVALEKKRDFDKWINMLVEVLGSGENHEVQATESTRNKRATLAVLTSLCKMYPKSVATKLIPGVVAIVSSASRSSRAANVVSECLSSIIPVYFDHAHEAGLTPPQLMNAFLDASNNALDTDIKTQVYQAFVESLSKCSAANINVGKSLVGYFVATCLAGHIFYGSQGRNVSVATQLAADMLSHEAASGRSYAALTMIGYAKALVLRLNGDRAETDTGALSLDNLIAVAVTGPGSDDPTSGEAKDNDDATLELCKSLLVASREIMSTQTFVKFIRHTQGETSTVVLRIWQDLLSIQSVCHNQMGGAQQQDPSFWAPLTEVVIETLESIQSHLPSHIFLAFATSLIQEGGTEELRARALQLVADRSLEIQAADAEAGLFRDLLPFLADLLDDKSSKGIVTQQSALVAIEHIARGLFISTEHTTQKHLEHLATAIGRSANFMEANSRKLDSGFSKIDIATKQLVCSASLCVATSVKVCGPRALPILPKLMKPTIRFLSSANAFLSENVDDKAEQAQARLMQLSTLRSLIAVSETLPQFLGPYLDGFFSPLCIPSEAMRSEDDDQAIAVKAATARICDTIASEVPARSLIPAICSSILESEDPSGILRLLSVLKTSIEKSKGAVLAAFMKTLLDAATYTFVICKASENESEVVGATLDVLVSLILKLSEVQLRSLYATLREWRGDIDQQDPSSTAWKRKCFWSVSTRLAKQLKSIFLPCLTTVLSDSVAELENAVSLMCNQSVVRTAEGRKKRRLKKEGTNVTEHDLESLQSLLACLEVSFRSDAHSGGSWIREGDSQRYNLFLEPLGKLLQCEIPSDTSKEVSYQSLVQGENDDVGSVVECIVALASAAGDEQLWKPLNHAVLQTCSNEDRAEVRKAGVKCLVSLIRSIGEEYMVLIPECLPVLSELLEDSDEEIAGLAQECITISEELLGESLEDNLR